MVIRASLDGYQLFIHNVYAPVSVPERKRFLSALPSNFPAGAHHLVLGDFNVPMDPVLDEASPYPHDLGREEFRSWLIQLGVLDAWRATYPDRRQFTGPTRRNRIDYCLMSPALFDDYLRDVRHVTEERWHHEDHLPVSFLLNSPSLPKQSRLPWKCPRWLLKDPMVQSVLEHTLNCLCKRLRCGENDNPGALLDEHKRADAIFLRQMFQERRNKDQGRLSELQERLSSAKALHAVAPTDATSAALQQATIEHQAFAEQLQARREQAKFDREIRLRENGSKFFLRPPAPSEVRVAIPGVKRADGSTATDPDEMAGLHRQYWGSIFQSPSWDLEPDIPKRRYDPIGLSDLLRHTTAKLSEADCRFMDAPMTANDFYWAIQHAPKDKSSGFDGLPAEYYQLFPETWALVYELIYAAQLGRGRMTKFQRRAYISLLYKKGDRHDPKNYRPITLLNHDAKFGPSILAHRLVLILPKLIHVDQTGFIAGRSIRHALLRFQDLQEFCRAEGLEDAGAVLLDFAKAFDSVLWPALDQVLGHLGFGPGFRQAVKTFFSGTLVSVLVNGVKSDYFELGCGVRQGDPLSPALFVLFIEPMLNYLRATTGHLGVKTSPRSKAHHLLAFADDCTGLLNDLRHAPTFIDAVHHYALTAGLQLNVDKTVILPFQALDEDIRATLSSAGFNVTPDNGSATLLGIPQSPTLPHKFRLDALLPKMTARCQLWRYRARTLRGRAVILRTIILPLLWYTAAVTALTPEFCEKVKRLCKAFLFQLSFDPDTKLRAPMASEWIYLPGSKGGLGIPEVRSFGAALRLCSLRDAMRCACRFSTIPRWFSFAAEAMTKALAGDGVTFDVLYAFIPTQQPLSGPWTRLGSFWLQTLQDWQRLRGSSENTTVFASFELDAPLWNNVHFTVGALKRHFSRASKLGRHIRALGFIRIQDFVDDHGALPSVELCKRLLADVEFASPRLRSLTASHFMAQVGSWINLDTPVSEVVRRPAPVTAASHGWSFRENLFVALENRDIYRLVHKLPKIERLPHEPLEIANEPNWDNVWRREQSLDIDVLPILSDLKFRLQHNGLGLRIKHQYHTEDVNCIHGCGVVESARHLFWDFSFAQALWRRFDPCFSALTDLQLSWEAVVFLQDAGLSRQAARIGQHNFLRVFNVIRACVLRSLWIHRNERIYHPDTQSSASFLVVHASCYVKLHLQRLAQSPDNPRLRVLCQSVLAAFRDEASVVTRDGILAQLL